jgi:hypothetical protein
LPLCVQSDTLPWVNGNIAVFAHPYFAVTDADGAFEIKDAPAGKYRLVVWNFAYNNGADGRAGQSIAIPTDTRVDLGEIVFTPPRE